MDTDLSRGRLVGHEVGGTEKAFWPCPAKRHAPRPRSYVVFAVKFIELLMVPGSEKEEGIGRDWIKTAMC